MDASSVEWVEFPRRIYIYIYMKWKRWDMQNGKEKRKFVMVVLCRWNTHTYLPIHLALSPFLVRRQKAKPTVRAYECYNDLNIFCICVLHLLCLHSYQRKPSKRRKKGRGIDISNQNATPKKMLPSMLITMQMRFLNSFPFRFLPFLLLTQGQQLYRAHPP